MQFAEAIPVTRETVMKRLRRRATRFNGVVKVTSPAQQYAGYGEVALFLPEPIAGFAPLTTGPLISIAKMLGCLRDHETIAD